MEQKLNLEYPGVYHAKNGVQDVIVLVEQACPFLTISALIDMTAFAKTRKIVGNDKLIKEIMNNPQNWLFVPLDIASVLTIGSEKPLVNLDVEMTVSELHRYGGILTKLGITSARRALMEEYQIPLIQTDVYLAKIREHNGLPYDFTGPK